MSVNKEDILNAISNMNILEIVELTKLMEKKFNISAANLQQTNSQKIDIEKKEEPESKTFSVVIKDYGKSKINVIKIVREISNLGLKEAKDFVESLPKSIKENLPKEDAEKLQKQLEESGASVELN